MATEKQIAANRANALRSTGPRTPDGKAIARRNALAHGLTAEQLMLDGEDPELFDTLREALFDEFAPASPYEEQLTHQVVSLLWRLRRIPAFEAALLSWIDYTRGELRDSDFVYRGLGPEHSIKRESPETRARLKLGRMLEVESSKNLTAKLSRYEAHLLRQLEQTRKELQEVQASRLEAEAGEDGIVVLPPPAERPAASERAAARDVSEMETSTSENES
jgi:hypothetical protein